MAVFGGIVFSLCLVFGALRILGAPDLLSNSSPYGGPAAELTGLALVVSGALGMVLVQIAARLDDIAALLRPPEQAVPGGRKPEALDKLDEWLKRHGMTPAPKPASAPKPLAAEKPPAAPKAAAAAPKKAVPIAKPPSSPAPPWG